MQINIPHDGNALAPGVLTGLVDRNEHVLLTSEAPSTALDNLAAQLAALRSRVLRPRTTDALTLPGLVAQIIGRAPGATLETADLERAFDLLTDTGPDCERVVLLLDRADALDPAALRYLQMIICDAPLQLLFVGGPKLYGLLMQADFGTLRQVFVAYAAAPAAQDATCSIPAAALPSLRSGSLGHPLLSGARVLA